MKFRVTAKDIKNGARGNPRCCPVALAISRKFPTFPVSVGFVTVGIGSSIEWEQAFLPDEVNIFIARFDDGLPVEPFEFELEGIQK